MKVISIRPTRSYLAFLFPILYFYVGLSEIKAQEFSVKEMNRLQERWVKRHPSATLIFTSGDTLTCQLVTANEDSLIVYAGNNIIFMIRLLINLTHIQSMKLIISCLQRLRIYPKPFI